MRNELIEEMTEKSGLIAEKSGGSGGGGGKSAGGRGAKGGAAARVETGDKKAEGGLKGNLRPAKGKAKAK